MNDAQYLFVKKIVIDEEVGKVGRDLESLNVDFENVIDMIEMKRDDKMYDWMSDNFLPEYLSITLADASTWANKMFMTRDFCEVKLEGDHPDDGKKALAAKRVINKTLNNKEIYHFHKYMRMRHINAMHGNSIVVCWWDKEFKDLYTGEVMEVQEPNIGSMDEYGNQMVAPSQMPMGEPEPVETPQIERKIVCDRFNYDVIDPRNAFFDTSTYSYSLQQKDWVTIRSEMTISDLFRLKDEPGYENIKEVIETLKKKKVHEATESSKIVEEVENSFIDNPNFRFDVYERFGKFWCIVKEKDEEGLPKTIDSGYDEDGELKRDAQLIETIIAFAAIGPDYYCLRFQASPFYDSTGKPYKPIIRSWCYVHPTKDIGLSDGKMSYELQVAINDTFNISNDRVMLATLPTLKGRKQALYDNDTIRFEPEHVMELDDPSDVEEFKISDNIQGALGQIGMLKQAMQQATARFPTSMGDLPSRSTTTATAVSAATGQSSERMNYKDLTIEYTFLTEFYWMILQMVFRFAETETVEKMLRELAPYLDPNMDYVYTPVTSAIETEYTKMRKIQMIDQMMGRVAKFPNPNTPLLLNFLLSKAFELYGDEFPEYRQFLLDPTVPPPPPGGQGSVQPTPEPANGQMMGQASNQMGIPMSMEEMGTREMAGAPPEGFTDGGMF